MNDRHGSLPTRLQRSIRRIGRSLARLPVAVWMLVAYTLLTFIALYPLSVQPHAYLSRIDAYQFVWNYWWVMQAAQHGWSPFFTPLLYYPEGVSLYFHTLNPCYAALTMPLQPLVGVVAAYNLIGMVLFITAAGGAAWLGTTISGSRWGGFIAGLVFGFAPTYFFHFDVGHSQMQTVVWLPIYVLSLYHWLIARDALTTLWRQQVRWLLAAALALTLTSYVDWQQVVYLIIFSVVAAVWLVVAQHHSLRPTLRAVLWRGGVLAGLYVLAVALLLLPTLHEFQTTSAASMQRSTQDVLDHAADLLALFVGSPYHPLWGAWSSQTLDQLYRPGMLVAVVSLSYTALLLAGVAVLRRWRQARFWLAALLLFLVLALGPQLRVGGVVTDVPLPYALLNQIRIMRVSRAPARYVIPALLFLAVLAAIGVAVLHQWRVGGQGLRPALPLLAAGLLLFEYLPVQMSRQPPPAAPAFFTDGTLADAGALLEVPNPDNVGMYYQTLHTRPVLYGQPSRDAIPGPLGFHLRDGIAIEQDMFVDPRANWHCALRASGFTHLIHYRQLGDADEQQRNTERVAAAMQGAAPLRESPLADLYRLPAGDPAQPCLIVGDGWSAARPFGEGQPFYRRMGQHATLGVLQPQAGAVQLALALHRFATPRTLRLLLPNGQEVAQVQVGTAPAPVLVHVQLPAGLTWLTLQSMEPAVSPAAYGFDETAPVAIGAAQVHASRR